MGYTETSNDLPIYYSFDEDELTFELLSDDEVMTAHIRPKLPRNFTIKYPVKAFRRMIQGELEYGTFYEVYDTHCIPIETFLYCMNNPEIGCEGFYLYCYLKYKNDLYESGYDISIEGLSDKTGLANKTLTHYLGQLKAYNMITFIHNQDYFSIAISLDERRATTYITNEYEEFNEEPHKYEKMKILSKDQYIKLKEKERERLIEEGAIIPVDIPVDELPY